MPRSHSRASPPASRSLRGPVTVGATVDNVNGTAVLQSVVTEPHCIDVPTDHLEPRGSTARE